MDFFEWLNGPRQTEVERAISLLNKQTHCFRFSKDGPPNHLMIGKFSRFLFFKKKYFHHYNIKVSSSGEYAMISSYGSVDFLFCSKEEVAALKQAISQKYGVKYE